MNDTYLGMEVNLMNYSNGEMMKRIVKKRAIDMEGKTVGILTHSWIRGNTANTIAENS